MQRTLQQKSAQQFRVLHQRTPGFIMPNAWDEGSAIVLAAEGFSAIGTTSAGIAFSMGRQDYLPSDEGLAVSRAEMLDRMGAIARAVTIPVNGDLEAGYGDRPEQVADTVKLAIEVGLAGGNVEDKPTLGSALYDEDLAVERIAAARERIDALGNTFVLTARTDAFQMKSEGALATVIRRANRYLEAGASCVFAPGPSDLETIATLVKEVAGPLNVVLGLGTTAGNAHVLIQAGVQRISVGGSIARAALGFVRASARELRDHGTTQYASVQLSHGELNALFESARSERERRSAG